MINLHIKCLKSEKTELSTLYGQFLINSLSPGQGITIGNLLRRVLLGDLGGTSITAVRFAGVKHEFSTIPGSTRRYIRDFIKLKRNYFKKQKRKNLNLDV